MEGARYLEDGRLTIFKRSGIYYARIRISASGRYIWRSLKTSNEQAAIDLGRRLLFQMEQRADRAFRQNPKYSPPSLTTISAIVSGIITTENFSLYAEADHSGFEILAGIRWKAGRRAIDDKVMRGVYPVAQGLLFESSRSCRKTPSCIRPTRTLQWEMMLGKGAVAPLCHYQLSNRFAWRLRLADIMIKNDATENGPYRVADLAKSDSRIPPASLRPGVAIRPVCPTEPRSS